MIHVENVNNFTIQGGGEPCPQCGGIAEYQSGTYTLVGSVIEAFRAPYMTKDHVAAVKEIVGKAAKGKVSTEDAIAQLTEVNEDFAAAFQEAPGIDWAIVLAIITLLYTIWSGYKSDKTAQAALAEARTQTRITERLLDEITKLNSSVEKSPPSPIRQEGSAQGAPPKNRAERRKAAAIARRQKKDWTWAVSR